MPSVPELILEQLRTNDLFESIHTTAWAILLILTPIAGTATILSRPVMKNLIKRLPGLVRSLGVFLQEQIDDPILKFPKLLRVTQYVMVGVQWTMAAQLFLIFSLLIVIWTQAAFKMTLLQNFGVLTYAMFTAYMSAVIKAQGSRDLKKLRDK